MEGLAAGESLSADKVILPAGVTLVSDPKMTVVHLSVRSAEVEETPVAAAPAEGAEGAAAAAPAEGEAAKDDKK
jgi:large subunit ribosomal protein L25